MQRVLRYDGLLPNVFDEQGQIRAITQEDIRAMKSFADTNRTASTPFDIVMEGETPGDDPARAADLVRGWSEAGATWWLEAMWGSPTQQRSLEGVHQRIRQGPPRIT